VPLYEYICPQCGYCDDVIQGVSEAPLTTCPQCGSNHFTKKISAPAFKLTGTGWYETDFKNKGALKAASEKTSTDTNSGDTA